MNRPVTPETGFLPGFGPGDGTDVRIEVLAPVTKEVNGVAALEDVGDRFLRGVSVLATVFSSGDANTFDHPRAWVLGAAALTGRVVEHPTKHILKAPLVYSTEVARSVTLDEIDQLREYDDPQQYGRPDEEPARTVSGDVTRSRWRAVFDRDSNAGRDQPPLPTVKAVKGLIYGLVNVRTDGRRVLFAVRNDGNHSWAYEVLEAEDFEGAYRLVREGG